MTTTAPSTTICAISTPPGTGAIALIRLSGPQAIAIADAIWQGKPLAAAPSHTAHLGTITAADGSPLDQAVATIYRAPRSFTGEDTVELAVHGSPYIQQQLLRTLTDTGATMAAPGEFSRRAFANGRLDLPRAEAIADLIAADSAAAHAIAISHMRGQYSSRLAALRQNLIDLTSLLVLELDFSEEDVEFAPRPQLLATAREIKTEVDRLAASFRAGQAIKDGIPVAIIGPTNAGKSSLLNALLGDDRAIVSEIHGTTRDIVEDRLHLPPYTFRIMDTAGLRQSADPIENLGIERSRRAASTAAIIIDVADATLPAPAEPQPAAGEAVLIPVANKADLAPAGLPGRLSLSAATGAGLDRLRTALLDAAAALAPTSASVTVTNERHYRALADASAAISAAITALEQRLYPDIVHLHLRATLDALASILGQVTTPDLLNTIFSRFCIGK